MVLVNDLIGYGDFDNSDSILFAMLDISLRRSLLASVLFLRAGITSIIGSKGCVQNMIERVTG